MAVILLLLISGDGVLRDNCELIEFNETYTEDGQLLVLRQIIFWGWQDCKRGIGDDSPGFRVIDFRLRRRADWPTLTGDVVRWHDQGRLREVRFKAVRYTWTLYDPEVFDRHRLARDSRQGLRRFLASQEKHPPLETTGVIR